jgi:dTDP-4-amino-4,6-dideoxygalactose transaminase
MNINLGKPQIGLKELHAASKVLRSKNLSQGKEVLSFEFEFSKIVGDRNCVAVNSGTSALHLALLALGISKGDQVIVPSFTFAATANAVRLAGAVPVFADIDACTFNIDPESISKLITKKTRAIVVVHLYGLPANMNLILKIAKKHQLLIIEDAAQAHLAQINNRNVGTFGDAAIFSFYATKNMTTGEGGMIVFSKDSYARIARLLRNQGMERKYENEVIGFNLRMTEIQAAIGKVQLKKLPFNTEMRIYNGNYLSQNLDSFVKVPWIPGNFKHVFHQYTIRVPAAKRSSINIFLNKKGVQTGIYYPIPVHKLKAFINNKYKLPVTDLAAKEVISIPVHPKLSRRELNYIIRQVTLAV